ncbi:hypothetical protein TrLO_g12731 [Triparma laevis f. longispina]|uniref:Uncharacterized protein n=1 Tax=Triparma laevis f. longispina TaxID=1714387 RepID=A0A9W6ZGR8_9STRA|nr:hypothetical protein TrLO_g12731 [Triparma laevis f. longispina]
MTIPDSLQKLGKLVSYNCFKLVPSYIDVGNSSNDATSEVLKYLYEKMKSDHMAKDIASLKRQVTERGMQNEDILAALKSNTTADQTAKIASLEKDLKIARLEKELAEKEVSSLKQELASHHQSTPNDSKKRKHN